MLASSRSFTREGRTIGGILLAPKGIGLIAILFALAAPAGAGTLEDWRSAVVVGCVGAIEGGAGFAAPGMAPLRDDGAGAVWGAGDDLRARLTGAGPEDAGRRVCRVEAGGAAMAAVVPEAFDAFLDWADAAAASGAWTYGEAARERRLVPIAARMVSARPNARGCAMEALFLADPWSGRVTLTVAETAGPGCGGAGG